MLPGSLILLVFSLSVNNHLHGTMSLEMTAETGSDAKPCFHNAFLNTNLSRLKGPNTMSGNDMFTKLVINKVLGNFTALLSVRCLYFDAIMKSYKAEQLLDINDRKSLLSDINESQLFCFALRHFNCITSRDHLA